MCPATSGARAWLRANTEDARVAQRDALNDAQVEQKSSPEHRLERRDGQQDGVKMLSVATSWSHTLREGRPGDSLGDTLDFQTIPNEFDDDRDGWSELLVHPTDGVPARFTLELYTDWAWSRPKRLSSGNRCRRSRAWTSARRCAPCGGPFGCPVLIEDAGGASETRARRQETLGTLPLCHPRSGHCRGSRTAAN